jgi:hypothetical protein
LEKRELSYFDELGAVDDSIRLSCRLFKLKEVSEELPGKEFGVLRRLCKCFCCPALIIFLKLQFDCNSFLHKRPMTLHQTNLESQTHMALNTYSPHTYSPFHNTNAKAQKFTFVKNTSIIHIKAKNLSKHSHSLDPTFLSCAQ